MHSLRMLCSSMLQNEVETRKVSSSLHFVFYVLSLGFPDGETHSLRHILGALDCKEFEDKNPHRRLMEGQEGKITQIKRTTNLPSSPPKRGTPGPPGAAIPASSVLVFHLAFLNFSTLFLYDIYRPRELF